MLAELEKAIEAKVDGVAVAGGNFMPGDAAADDLIDKAFAQGTIVTTTNMPLPQAQAKYGSMGMGSVGGPNHAAGFALASEVVKRARLKAGDSAMVWGNKGKPSEFAQRSVGMIDGFEQAGVRVFYLEIDPAYGRGGGDAAGDLAAAIRAHPDLKAVVTDRRESPGFRLYGASRLAQARTNLHGGARSDAVDGAGNQGRLR